MFVAAVVCIVAGIAVAVGALDEIVVQLKWVHQAQFAGFYVALERGYYAEENISVTLVEGGAGIDAMQQVISGVAEFGVAAPEKLIWASNFGSPVLAIATVFRLNPTVFISLQSSGIKRPSDLAGRSAAVLGVDEFETQLRAMFNRLGLDIDQAELVPHTYDLTGFYVGEVDSIAVYSTGGLIRSRQAGHELNLIWPDDYGVHLYSDTIITTDTLIDENPGLVTRFLRATLRGWRDAIEDPEAAVAITLNYARESDDELQLAMMYASLPLVHTGRDQIGWMRAEIWESMHEMLLAQGILDQPADLSSVYTMQFLHEIYGETP